MKKFTKDQQTHLAALDHGDPVSFASFADRLEEDGHPLAPLFRRMFHAVQNPVASSTFGRHTRELPLGRKVTVALGTQHLPHGVSIPAARIASTGEGRGLYSQVPLRKTEWAALHKHLTGKDLGWESHSERPENIVQEPDQLAAMKAPVGGMVANGMYYPGGKYLPRLLKRIRDVRKNAQPVQLARGEEQKDTPVIKKLPLRLLACSTRTCGRLLTTLMAVSPRRRPTPH